MSLSPLRLIACALFASAFTLGLPAQAGPDGARKPPGKVTFHKSPSEEAPAAREKRLKRECKGRPNAGMCAGYTR